MKAIATSFNINILNTKINSVVSQLEELDTFHKKLFGSATTCLPTSYRDKRPSTIEELLSFAEDLVSCRDNVVSVLNEQCESIEARIGILDQAIPDYVKPKLLAINAKEE